MPQTLMGRLELHNWKRRGEGENRMTEGGAGWSSQPFVSPSFRSTQSNSPFRRNTSAILLVKGHSYGSFTKSLCFSDIFARQITLPRREANLGLTEGVDVEVKSEEEGWGGSFRKDVG